TRGASTAPRSASDRAQILARLGDTAAALGTTSAHSPAGHLWRSCEMERNDFSSDRPTQSDAQTSGAGNTSGFGDSGNTSGTSSFGGSAATSGSSTTDNLNDRASGVAERARNMAGSAKEK